MVDGKREIGVNCFGGKWSKAAPRSNVVGIAEGFDRWKCSRKGIGAVIGYAARAAIAIPRGPNRDP